MSDHFPNLRLFREQQGLSREELAWRAGCDAQTIRRAEGAIPGKYGCGITLKVAVKIADAIGVGMDELLGRTVQIEITSSGGING